MQARLCWKWTQLLWPTVQFFLVACALYVGYTGVSDHWSDVLAGLLQGALVAGLTVRYISEFFKARPPQHCPKEEELERKPSLLSFYSGHASFGMYCVGFLAHYMQARLCWKWTQLLRPTVQFFLVAFALYVGYTRVSDHWSDVLAGPLQGALVAGLTVCYVSDFFKARPPQHCLKGEGLERKPSLSLTVTLGEDDHNHSGYPHSSS
ncbi:phospholipid phosphatase 2-like [Cebus imitator]|uniref:phospholipid phosphatase 2-like n=1 Tax=Cebus imitator TaxID=2715852 RepID=UPI00189A10B2|nr:phospholipid phosphatase 2-like [Cebus imitator]